MNDGRQTNAVDRHIGAKVKAFRHLKGISQEVLGARLGITFQQVQKYERGVNRISAGRLYDIAGVLGVAVTAFYEGLDGPATDTAPLPDLLPIAASRDGAALLREINNAPQQHVRVLLEVARSLASTRTQNPVAA